MRELKQIIYKKCRALSVVLNVMFVRVASTLFCVWKSDETLSAFIEQIQLDQGADQGYVRCKAKNIQLTLSLRPLP